VRLIGEGNKNNPRILEVPDLGLSKILSIASRSSSFPGLFESLLSLVNEMPFEYIEGLKEIPDLQFHAYS
jgi:hypothetical protein